MTEWKKIKISEIGRVVTGKTPKTAEKDYYGGDIPFLTPSDDMDVKYVEKTRRKLTQKGMYSVKGAIIPSASICVSCIGSDLGKVVITTNETVTNQQINSIIVDTERFDVDFVYYAMVILGEKLNFHSKTSTAVPIINKSTFLNYEICCPHINEQRKIGKLLSIFDDKMAINTKINENLLQQAHSIFFQEFLSFDNLPNGWQKSSLLGIANYLNGLAMQKYRPTNDEQGIPVLKIRELRQGSCDSGSELCSSSIKSEYIIHDGDVIFSWSGSLLVDFWCGGTCGLNQHLFKVTSSTYDMWFCYAWTNHHLQKFVAMAADMATTMGHIKREELAKAMVLVPPQADYSRIGDLLAPLYNLVIANRIENRKLSALRDELLPQLMSGQLDVSGVLL